MKPPQTRKQKAAKSESSAQVQKRYKAKLIASGGKTINFACHAEAAGIMKSLLDRGYKTGDLLNYAITLLPDNLEKTT